LLLAGAGCGGEGGGAGLDGTAATGDGALDRDLEGLALDEDEGLDLDGDEDDDGLPTAGKLANPPPDDEDCLDGPALGGDGSLDLDGAALLGIAPAGMLTLFLDGFMFLCGATAGLEGRGVGSNDRDPPD